MAVGIARKMAHFRTSFNKTKIAAAQVIIL